MNDKIKRIIEDDSRWKPHQVDHLLLLIGGNPLPNAVAAVLLTSPNGTITLIHSKKESPNTFIEHQDVDSFPVAQKLESWLNGFGYKEVRLTGVHESRPDSIIQGVLEALKTFDAVKVGINYTGGTKAMSVHAYRAVEQWVAEQSKEGKKIEASFSYLDARQMKMVFDRTTSMPSEALYAGRVMKLELEKDLLQIHGWKLKHQPIQTPILPQSAQALLDVYTTPKDTCCWQEWLEKELFKKAKRSEQILVTCSRSSDDQPCNFDHPGEKWKSKSNLKNTTLSWPTVQELKTLVETMKKEMQQTDGLSLGDLSKAESTCHYQKEPEDFCKWLNGGWLESAVLSALQQSLKNNVVDYIGMNLEPETSSDNPTEFEFDVVAIRGYQLFAFSCSTNTEKKFLKLKLFEAYIRARQLGGDEACVALVCCSNDPSKLEYEMRRDFNPEGRIRVFGIQHFDKLAEHLSKWMDS